MGKTSNTDFANRLAAQSRANIYPEERNMIEQTLGEGALKFKLGRGGMRTLMAALDKQSKGTKGS